MTYWEVEFLVVRDDSRSLMCAICCGSMPASWLTSAIQLTDIEPVFHDLAR